MNKLNKIFLIIIVILVITLSIMTHNWWQCRTTAFKVSQELYQVRDIWDIPPYTIDENGKITNTIELEQENVSNIQTITNTTNTYVPDGVEIADSNDTSGIKASDLEFNRSSKNVTIQVLEYTITRESVEILITDNNKYKFGWGESFRIQKKVNDKWKELEMISDNLAFSTIGYVFDENNQLKMKTNYGKYYSALENGIYRIVKPVYDKSYIDLYSNEFEIK